MFCDDYPVRIRKLTAAEMAEKQRQHRVAQEAIAAERARVLALRKGPVGMPPAKGDCIYVVRAAHLHKIGFTGNLPQRLDAIRTCCPVPVEIALVIHGGRMRGEKHLHGVFAAKRRHGEWFDLDDDDLAWLRRWSNLYDIEKPAEATTAAVRAEMG